MHVCMLSHVQLFATPRSILLCPWDYPGKNIGGGCPALLQVISLTQGSIPSLMSPALAGGFFTISTTWEALNLCISSVQSFSRVQLIVTP